MVLIARNKTEPFIRLAKVPKVISDNTPKLSPRIKHTVWRRQSSPLPVPDNPVSILRQKLEEEEKLLLLETEKMLSATSIEREELWKSINRRRSFVNAMKSSLGVQENMVLSEDYISIRYSPSEEFKRVYCIINYPFIRVLKSESDYTSTKFIQIDEATQLIIRSSHEFSFMLKFEKNNIEFSANSYEERDQWTNAISIATGLPITERDTKKRRSETIANFNDYSLFDKSICEDYESINDSFSLLIETTFEDGSYKITSGLLDDIITWCIIHSQTRKNEDSATFFLCKHWVCTTDEFTEKIIQIWRRWEYRGFPMHYPRNILSERLANFVAQYLSSPLIDVNTWDRERANFKSQQEVASRRKLQKQIESIHTFFKKSLKNVKIPRRTIGLNPNGAQRVMSDSLSALEQENPSESAINYNIKQLADQITLDQAELFEKISIDELLDKNWENPKKSPCLKALSDLCNSITSWVISAILTGKDQKEQLARYTKFIKLANRLHYLHNYNGCTAVIGGLASAPISRLKRLKETPENTKLDKLIEIYTPCNGYKNYRNLSKPTKCIPLIGVYLRDLTLSVDGNAKYLDEGKNRINFERMRLVAKPVLELHNYDTSGYLTELTPVPVLKTLLSHLCEMNQDSLYEISLKLEPKPCNSPKQEIRSLKTKVELLEEENEKLRVEQRELQANQKTMLELISSMKSTLDSLSEKSSSNEKNEIYDQLTNAMECIVSPNE